MACRDRRWCSRHCRIFISNFLLLVVAVLRAFLLLCIFVVQIWEGGKMHITCLVSMIKSSVVRVNEVGWGASMIFLARSRTALQFQT